MKILFHPLVSANQKIHYEFVDEKIYVMTPNGEVDLFDFSNVPDGRIDVDSIKTNLDPQPVISAKKVEGKLCIELMNYIGTDATEKEKFPDWFDNKEMEEVSG